MHGAPIALRLSLAAALACGGARSARAGDPIAFPFASKARSPEGPALRLTFSPRAAEVYEERVVRSGKTYVSEGAREKALAGAMTAVHRCEEVRPDGTRVMTSRIEKLEGDDAEDAELAADVPNVVVRWEAGPSGAITSLTAEGGTEAARAKVDELLFAPGARAFLVFPSDGVRVGQALDYVKMFGADEVRRALVDGDAPAAPESKSEVVCVRKTLAAGEAAVEFALNAVLYAAFDPPGGGRMESAARYSGAMIVSLQSGMPIGKTEVRLEGRVAAGKEGARVVVTRDVKLAREIKRRSGPAASKPGAPAAAAPTPFDDSPALPKPDGVLSTAGYSPLEREKPYFGKLPASDAPGSVTSIGAKPAEFVSWLGIVRGIDVDGARGRTRLLLESKYFDGLTDSHVFCVDLNGGGDFVATLVGAQHPVRPLALVRVYGTVTAVKDGLPRVRADYVRQWDQGRFTFMFMQGPQKGSERWRELIDPSVNAENVYSPFPTPDYYRNTLGAREDFAPGKVQVPGD